MSKNKKIKVLHIGNIANNAYQNAKILNAGDEYECDVLCNDYYHIMGCPEWDDAEFDSRGIDQFYPNWSKINLHGYKRPRWFIQGKLELCIKYLIHRRREHHIIESVLWHYINLDNTIYTLMMSSSTNIVGVIYAVVKRIKVIKNKVLSGRGAYLARVIRRRLHRLFDIIFFCLIHPIVAIKKISYKITGKEEKEEKEEIEEIGENYNKDDPFEEELQSLREMFEIRFPQKKCLFGELTRSYIGVKKKWKTLFSEYDIIEAYAYNSIYPLIAGEKNYVAFEHGTIRDIEKENTELSQLVMLAYANAAVIYSTNTDCYKSAQYITENSSAKIICGYHGLDVEGIVLKQSGSTMDINNPLYDILNEDTPLFFAPARFTYDDKRKIFLKGQEIYLQAAQNLSSKGLKFKLLIIEWGEDVPKAKKIINKSYPNLHEHIVWIQPLEKTTYYYVMQHVDAVIDQLQLNAFGAIAIETLCSERAVLITKKISEEDQIRYWGKPAPVLFVNDLETMEMAMKKVIMEPEDRSKIAKEEKKWVLENHSKKQIYKSSKRAFNICLNTF